MRRTFLFVAVVLLAVLLSSCATIRDPYLVSVKTDSNEVYNDRGGYSIQTIEDEGAVVSMEGLDLGVKDKGVVLVELENKDDSPFNFVDTNMEIFGETWRPVSGRALAFGMLKNTTMMPRPSTILPRC